MIRRSATAAAKHRRSANTAFRAVAADRPASNISATQTRTAAFVIFDQWCRPELRQHLLRHRRPKPRPSRDAQVMPSLDPLRRPRCQPDLAATRVEPGTVGQFELELGLPPLRINQPPPSLRVHLPGMVAIAHLIPHERSTAAALLPCPSFNPRHGQNPLTRRYWSACVSNHPSTAARR